MKIHLDMWYGDAPSSADKIDISFYPWDGTYRGNIYKGGRVIGDYTVFSSSELEKMFPHLIFNWG